MQTSRNVFRRHPFITSFVIIAGVFFAFARWADMTTPPPKKLDYAKPIVTSEGAIICPQALFYDIRADHGPQAVYEVFGALTHRAEKAHALGCDEITGGIPVTAHRMTHPLEDFISVTFPGIQTGEFFTMEGNLENSEGAVQLAKPAATSLPQPPVAQPERPTQQVESQEAEPLPGASGTDARTPEPEQQPPAPVVRQPPPQD